MPGDPHAMPQGRARALPFSGPLRRCWLVVAAAQLSAVATLDYPVARGLRSRGSTIGDGVDARTDGDAAGQGQPVGLAIATLRGDLHVYDVSGELQWIYSLGEPLLSISGGKEAWPGGDVGGTGADGGVASAGEEEAQARLVPGMDGTLWLQTRGQLRCIEVDVGDIAAATPFAAEAFPGVYIVGNSSTQVLDIRIPSSSASAADAAAAEEA